MFRTILFRGKRLDNGEWVEGFYVCLEDRYKKRKTHRIYLMEAEADCEDYYSDWYEVDPKTIGQFTGLYDKKSKKIFENDICRNTKTEKIIYVAWSGVMAGYVWGETKENSCLHDFGELFRAYDKYEVIGNMHDNFELLKGE